MDKKRWAGHFFNRLICAIAVFSMAAAAAASPKPVLPNSVFSIAAYGAVGDGLTDNTAAIQAAIAAASLAGGGVVEFPSAAKPYECGPITLSGNIKYQIDSAATLQCIPYAAYPLTGTAYVNFISANNARNIEISGKGTIDGQGADWWKAFNADGNMPHRPYLIKFSSCTTVYVHDITLSNSPMFHLVLYGADMTVDGLTILAPANAPNTDGIDPAGSNFLIENCSIAVGDDNIALKPGNSACKNFTITNCVFGTGHGLSVGGQTNFGLDSLTVTHCSFKRTTNGIRLKANRTCGGLVHHLLYSDITMDSVQYPVYFSSYYNEAFSAIDSAQAVTATTPIWENIAIRNLVSTNSTKPAITVQGLPEMPFQNVTFANTAFTGSVNFSIAHAHGVNFFNTTFNRQSAVLTTSPLDATIYHLTITTGPQSQTIAEGSTMKLSVSVTADFTPTYQWFHNDSALAAGSAASFTIDAFGTMDAGAYSVLISDSAGSIQSDLAIMALLGPLSINPKTFARQIKTNNFAPQIVDCAGRSIPNKNPAATSVHNFYLMRDASGKWGHKSRLNF